MARTDVTVLELSTAANQIAGISFTGNSTTGIADGHKFLNGGDVFVQATKSGTTGAITFVTPATAPGGDAIEDRSYTISVTTVPKTLGPFTPSIFNQADGKVNVNYETGEETEFEILPIKMVKQR